MANSTPESATCCQSISPVISGHIDADGRLLSILLIGEPAPIIDGEAV